MRGNIRCDRFRPACDAPKHVVSSCLQLQLHEKLEGERQDRRRVATRHRTAPLFFCLRVVFVDDDATGIDITTFHHFVLHGNAQERRRPGRDRQCLLFLRFGE